MKTICIICCLFVSSVSWGQCFSEKLINQYLEQELKKPCVDFPAEVEMHSFKLEKVQENITLFAEDISRLQTSYLTIKGSAQKEILIRVMGKVRFHQKVFGFYAGEFISAIDESQGELDLGTLQSLNVRNFPALQQRLGKLLRSRSLAISAKADETIDFNNQEMLGMFTVYNAGRVQNVKVRSASHLQILSVNPKPTIVTNLDFETGRLLLINVEFYPMDKECKARSFDFTNSTIKAPGLNVTNENNVYGFQLDNSKVLFRKPNVFPTDDIEIQDSVIEGAILSIMKDTSEVEIMNSSVTLDSFPDTSVLTELFLSGNISIIDTRIPLKLSNTLKIVRLIGLDLSQLTLEVIDVSKLMILDLTASDIEDLHIINPEKAKFTPGSFSAHANDKKSQQKLRKIFKTKAVSNENWLPL